MDALWRQKESIDAPGVAAKDFGVVFAPSSSSGFSDCISHHNASKSLAIGGTSGFRAWWAGKFPGRVSTTVFAHTEPHSCDIGQGHRLRATKTRPHLLTTSTLSRGKLEAKSPASTGAMVFSWQGLQRGRHLQPPSFSAFVCHGHASCAGGCVSDSPGLLRFAVQDDARKNHTCRFLPCLNGRLNHAGQVRRCVCG